MNFETPDEAEIVLERSGWIIYKRFMRSPIFFEIVLYTVEEQMDAMNYLIREWDYTIEAQG
jgi:hypothetical protein